MRADGQSSRLLIIGGAILIYAIAIATTITLVSQMSCPSPWWKARAVRQVICPDISSHEQRQCLLGTDWSSWIKVEDGQLVEGMQVCATPGGQFERMEQNGITYWRFRADVGRLVKMYRLYQPSKKCSMTLLP